MSVRNPWSEPWSWRFWNAVRELECRSGSPRVGTSAGPEAEQIFFSQRPSLSHPPTELESIEEVEGGRKVVLSFYGLFGSNGPMPIHFTESAILACDTRQGQAFADFCDLFHHRLVSLYYRSWAINRLEVSCDRGLILDTAGAEGGSNFILYLGSTFGAATPGGAGDGPTLAAQIYFSGWLSSQLRTAEGLQSILTEYFAEPIAVVENHGLWQDLPDSAWCLLGRGGESTALGVGTFVGRRVWDCQHQIRLLVGPLAYADFEEYLPSKRGGAWSHLCRWLDLYLGREFLWSAQLVLRASDVPETVLSSTGGSRLGLTTWLKSRPGPSPRDAVDLILTPRLPYV